jgi:hypothetical protein
MLLDFRISLHHHGYALIISGKHSFALRALSLKPTPAEEMAMKEKSNSSLPYNNLKFLINIQWFNVWKKSRMN